MNKTSRTIGLCFVLFLLLAGSASAQNVSEAYGTIVDSEDNPVPGVKIVFTPRGNKTLHYSDTTNKKGKYFVVGMFTPKENDRWDVTLEAEGYLPIKVNVESRTVNRVLVTNDETKLKAGDQIGDLPIRPLGKCRVDIVLASEEEVIAASQPQVAQPGDIVVNEEGEEVVVAAAPEKDPWDEALSLVRAGSFDAALPAFAKAIEKQPEDAERHEVYAKVLYDLERYDEAEAESLLVVELDPSRMDARRVLAGIYIAQDKLDEALTTLHAAAEIAPGDIDIQERLAFVAGETGQIAESIQAYENITTIDPANANAWLALAGLYHQQGDSARSEAAYQKVVEIDPSSAYQTFYNIGVLIMNRDDRSDNDTNRAVEAFRKAIEIKPDYAPAYQQLAYAQLGLADMNGAAATVESYLAANPDGSAAPQMKGLLKSIKP